eukprot:scaffold218653_cov35-Tisochrysis_lutea.AAC.1
MRQGGEGAVEVTSAANDGNGRSPAYLATTPSLAKFINEATPGALYEGQRAPRYDGPVHPPPTRQVAPKKAKKLGNRLKASVTVLS